jgi:hypothetical protein
MQVQKRTKAAKDIYLARHVGIGWHLTPNVLGAIR